MIVCVKYDSWSNHGHALHAQFRLRHQCFIERQDYKVSQYRGMEYDQYDTPAALYLVYLSPEGEAWGCSRLTPVSQGSMLRDLWPNLIERPEDIFRDDVWEGTRFCVKKELPAKLRLRIRRELVIGYLEMGLAIGMKKVIGVMPSLIFKRVFIDAGCRYEFLGPTIKIPSGESIQGAAIDISWEALKDMRKVTDIYEAVVVGKDGGELRISAA